MELFTSQTYINLFKLTFKPIFIIRKFSVFKWNKGLFFFFKSDNSDNHFTTFFP